MYIWVHQGSSYLSYYSIGVLLHFVYASVLHTAGAQTIRLSEGQDTLSGRVEVFIDDVWGTVCDYGWDRKDALVVCKELGYVDVRDVKYRAYFGKGTGPVLLANLNCIGSERSLLDCSSGPWYIGNCPHERDAGVICSEVQLTTTSPSTEPTNKFQSPTIECDLPGLSSGGIVGISIACVVVVCLFVSSLILFVLRKRKSQKTGLPDLMIDPVPYHPDDDKYEERPVKRDIT